MGRNESTESETSQDEVELGGERTRGTRKMSQAVNDDSVTCALVEHRPWLWFCEEGMFPV